VPDIVNVLWRLFSVRWDGLPVASLVVLVVGGLMYAAMSTSTRSTGSSTSLA
jgi:hypothetical protein